jgi:hypothetical protein
MKRSEIRGRVPVCIAHRRCTQTPQQQGTAAPPKQISLVLQTFWASRVPQSSRRKSHGEPRQPSFHYFRLVVRGHWPRLTDRYDMIFCQRRSCTSIGQIRRIDNVRDRSAQPPTAGDLPRAAVEMCPNSAMPLQQRILGLTWSGYARVDLPRPHCRLNTE